MFVCPISGRPLSGWRSPLGFEYPMLDGVPVLVAEPEQLLARHGVGAVLLTETPTEDVVDAPDPVSPFLPPALLEAPGGLGAWLSTVEETPASVAAAWGHSLAPAGAAADLACGLGEMALRMASRGRAVVAMDRSPRTVLLARELLLGRVREAAWPTWRGGAEARPVPLIPARPGQIRFAIADAARPPLAEGALAWVHLGNVVDVAAEGPAALIEAAAALLAPGGLLTVTTPYDLDRPTVAGGMDPEAELVDAIDSVGLDIVAERDEVPWVIRQYQRGYRVLFTHCLAARRPEAG